MKFYVSFIMIDSQAWARLQLDNWEFEPTRVRKFFFPPLCPDWLRGPLSLLSNG